MKGIDLIRHVVNDDRQTAFELSLMLVAMGWMQQVVTRFAYMAWHEDPANGYRASVKTRGGTVVQFAVASQGGHRVDCWSSLGLEL